MTHAPATVARACWRSLARHAVAPACGAVLVCFFAAAYVVHRSRFPHPPHVSAASGPAFPATAPSTRPTAPPLPGEWKLTFQDDFEGRGLSDLWTPHQYWSDGHTAGEGDEESDPANVAVAEGSLRLAARKDNRFGKPYTGALVQSGGIRGRKGRTFAFLYGYAEARVRIPPGRGLWPAFWLMPASYRDANGEIDIMDNGTGDPNVLHAGAIRQGRQDQHQHPGTLPPGFHSFAVEWQRDHIAWFVDGIEWARTTDRRVICVEPMYPIFDLAVGGNWGGPPDAHTRFPAVMEVDWIVVWQHP